MTRALGVREERRHAAWLAAIVDEARPLEGGLLGWAGAGAWANQALALGLEGPVPADTAHRIGAFFQARGGQGEVVVSPWAHPSLQASLRAAGWRAEGEDELWALPLDGPGRDEGAAPRVREARTPEERAWWACPPGRAQSAVEAKLTARLRAAPDVIAALAWDGGEVVGVAGLHLRDGLAGLFGAWVREDRRGQGVHTSLIRWRLAHARRLGAEHATLQTFPDLSTASTAARRGFVRLGTRSLWRPPRA